MLLESLPQQGVAHNRFCDFCFSLPAFRNKKISLNSEAAFVRTGNTTVAKLYEILAYLEYLSNGDMVLKNPADFAGECLGKSEINTNKILKVIFSIILVIDEAYMLDSDN
ncbi:hypothetical protein Neosp_010042 [[Neocosmospora] mangrovei]